jgi:arylsulfatase
MATVVDVTGAKYPTDYKGHKIQPLEGISLRPALAGQPLARKNPIYWEHEGNCAIRRGPWKAVTKLKEPWELYNIDEDRTEQHNLVNEKPELAKELIAEWEAWAKRADVDPWPGPKRPNSGDQPKAAGKAKKQKAAA